MITIRFRPDYDTARFRWTATAVRSIGKSTSLWEEAALLPDIRQVLTDNCIRDMLSEQSLPPASGGTDFGREMSLSYGAARAAQVHFSRQFESIRIARAGLIVIDSVTSLPDNSRPYHRQPTAEQARRRRNFLQQP